VHNENTPVVEFGYFGVHQLNPNALACRHGYEEALTHLLSLQDLLGAVVEVVQAPDLLLRDLGRSARAFWWEVGASREHHRPHTPDADARVDLGHGGI
jgi:hypothetical protein